MKQSFLLTRCSFFTILCVFLNKCYKKYVVVLDLLNICYNIALIN